MSRRLLITGGSGFIGTQVVKDAIAAGYAVLNADKAPPLEAAHAANWRSCDIMNGPDLQRIAAEFQPTAIAHLAARTDCDESTTVERGYSVNTTGTSNVIAAAKMCSNLESLLITSSQYVFHRHSALPNGDMEYHPITIYGESKVITERLTRTEGSGLPWIIVRPTTIWGPWCLRHVRTLFYAMERGLYFHPGSQACTRAYGYVGNVSQQMLAAIESPAAKGKVFYVGDHPVNLPDWVDAISIELVGRPARRAPRPLIHTLAKIGDVYHRILGKRFLIDSTRFESMTKDFPAPMQPIHDLIGAPRFNLEGGVKETIAWYRNFAASTNLS